MSRDNLISKRNFFWVS